MSHFCGVVSCQSTTENLVCLWQKLFLINDDRITQKLFMASCNKKTSRSWYHHLKILFENADLNNISCNIHFVTLKFFMQKKLLLLNGTLIFEKLSKYNGLILRCKVRPWTIRRNGLAKTMQSVQQWHNFDVECSRLVSRLGVIVGNQCKKESALFVICERVENELYFMLIKCRSLKFECIW